MKYFKKVLMPIEVSAGNYCWGNGRICEHFGLVYASNKHVQRTCKLGFHPLRKDKEERILKPKECKTLKEWKE